MFKKFLFLALLLCLFSCQKTAVQKYPFLWEVSTPNQSQNYIWGIPNFASEDFKADSIILKRFEESDQIVFEMNQENFAMYQQFLFNEKGYYPPEINWREKFPNKIIDALENRLNELDWSLGHLPRMRPWLINQTIYNLELNQNHYQSHFIESNFYHRAKAENKSVTGLIEAVSIWHILADIEENDQITLLENHLNNKSYSSFLESYYEAYLHHNKSKIDSLVVQRLNALPSSIHKKIKERNAKLTEQSISIMQQDGNKLFIFNLDNLLGNYGILKKLEEAGYRVK